MARTDEDSGDAMVTACERFLTDRHCTLWGEAFNIIGVRCRRQAAEWLAEQIRGVLETSSLVVMPLSALAVTTAVPSHRRLLLAVVGRACSI